MSEVSNELTPEIMDSLENAYNVKVIDLVGLVQQEIELINFIQEQKNLISQYNQRQLDLATLNVLKDLLEAQSPRQLKEGDVPTETVYEAALNAKSQNSIAEVIGEIVATIKKDYKKKKDGGE